MKAVAAFARKNTTSQLMQSNTIS